LSADIRTAVCILDTLMRKGKFHGICRVWHENGRLTLEEISEDGVRVGAEKNGFLTAGLNLRQAIVRGKLKV